LTKKRRTRTKVSEEEFDVTVKDTSIGTKTPERVTTVTANDAESALKTATANTPTRGSEEITVTKSGDKQKVGSGTGGVYSMGESHKKRTMKSITEGATYPYSASLPKVFEKFLVDEKIEYRPVGNHVMFEARTKNELKVILRRLKNANDQAKGDLIYHGISESTK